MRKPTEPLVRIRVRSRRRLVLGIFTIFLGLVSLIGFFSISYIAGIAIVGGFYGLILIALGLGLILPREEIIEEAEP